jgi:hypothetical protein
MPKPTPDLLVVSFLKAMKDAGSPTFIVYQPNPAEATIRIASNVNEERTQALLKWLKKLDPATLPNAVNVGETDKKEEETPPA